MGRVERRDECGSVEVGGCEWEVWFVERREEGARDWRGLVDIVDAAFSGGVECFGSW